MSTLTVIIPAYNEQPWLDRTVARVLQQRIAGVDEFQILIVNDGSTDGTDTVIKALERQYPQVKGLEHVRNQGKGAALRTALSETRGEFVIIQDADLEYDPACFALMLEPLIEGRADCVYGSRFKGSSAKRVLFFWHYVGNNVLTLLTNICANLNLSDMETGYKAFRRDLIKTITIESNDFCVEPELTIKIARKNVRFYEVGISYNGRTYAEGKKIRWTDGVKALAAIIKFTFKA